MYDGNDFMAQILSTQVIIEPPPPEAENPEEPVILTVDVAIGVDVLSGLVSASYSDSGTEYAMNAVSVPVRNGERLSSEILVGGHVDVFLKEKMTDVRAIRQGSTGCIALGGNGIYDGDGVNIIESTGIENVFCDGNSIFILSGGMWFSRNPNGTTTILLSGTPDGESVTGVGNVGNITYVAAPEMYRVDYSTRPDTSLQMSSRSNIAGISAKVSPWEDGSFMVVSRSGSGSAVQSYVSQTGGVGEPILFRAVGGSEINPAAIAVMHPSEMVI